MRNVKVIYCQKDTEWNLALTLSSIKKQIPDLEFIGDNQS